MGLIEEVFWCGKALLSKKKVKDGIESKLHVPFNAFLNMVFVPITKNEEGAVEIDDHGSHENRRREEKSNSSHIREDIEAIIATKQQVDD